MNVVMDEAVIHSAPNNDVLGDSFTIPGTNDEVKATFAKALLRLRIITSPQSGPVAQITRDNSGTRPLDLFLQLGAKWLSGHQGQRWSSDWMPKATTQFRFRTHDSAQE